MKNSLHQVNSISEGHSFSGIPLEFGFIGKKNQNELTEKKFYQLKQVHGTKLVEAPFESSDVPEGDGIYTVKKEVCVSVRTADCLPILVTDDEASFVMALHAGWRGLAQGIIGKSFSQLKSSKDFKEKNLRIFLGPCIEKEAFEVGPEVIQAFLNGSRGLLEEKLFNTCYRGGLGDRSYFSLKSFAFLSLLSLGVKEKNISSLRSCTHHNQEDWFSYRREGSPLSGYNWSWITLL